MKKYLLLAVVFSAAVCNSQPVFTGDYPDSLSKKRLYIIAGTETAIYGAGLSFLGVIWYSDQERVPFHYYNDMKGYLQMDKAGHTFGAYHESYNAYYALRWAGVKKKQALMFGAPMGLVFQTPIEIFDGLYDGWGFSWPDMLANTLGTTLFTVQEAFLDEQVVLMKFSYSPSIYPKYHTILGETPLENFFLDYNGHTHWLSLNMQKMTSIKKIPPWLNLAIGYSGNGMIKEFENPTWYRGKPFPTLERYRQWLVSMDVDLTRIPVKRLWVAKLFRYVNMLKVPFPSIEFNRVEGIKFRGLYY
ncbi:MAG: YfiM family protein [Cyclobacteriaceae bacterium]|nr:YfiM family protein [Cyclobacteriaceae bacterium]